MAGLWNFFDRSQPGPGVSKNAPKKRRFFLFWEVFYRKFWSLVLLNLLFVLSCIPIVTIGPALAGFSYVLRHYARGEHSFLWMDYRDAFKENWKQSVAVNLLSAAAFVVLGIALYFYKHFLTQNLLVLVPYTLCLGAFLILLFMQYYLYALLVSYRLSFRQLLKDAVAFAFVGLWWNLLITAVLGAFVFTAVILFLLFPAQVVLVLLFLAPLILISFFGLIVAFIVWPIIDKYMAVRGKDEIPPSAEEQIFEDSGSVLDKSKSDRNHPDKDER